MHCEQPEAELKATRLLIFAKVFYKTFCVSVFIPKFEHDDELNKLSHLYNMYLLV